jgi:iron complex transport system substrate-binding protein
MLLKIIKYFIIFLVITNSSFAEDRIVSLSPNITEILFKLDLGEYLVGVSKECNYPDDAQKIDKVGSYNSINIEKIISLKPTVVFGMKEGYTIGIKKKLDLVNIENHFFDSHNYKDVIVMIKYLSDRFNKDSQGLIYEINRIYSEKKELTKSALFLLNLDPLISAGNNSFINDILKCGGFKNYIKASLIDYPKINIEKLYLNKPDYILISHNAKGSGIKLFKENLKRLKINSKVVIINEDIFVRPSYRIVEACYFLRKLKD